MQFQDMTSQLIDRTLKRVTGLREFLGTLGEHGAEILPESDSEEIVELLGKVSMALAIQSLGTAQRVAQVGQSATPGERRHRMFLNAARNRLI
jgi:hypothetical protein